MFWFNKTLVEFDLVQYQIVIEGNKNNRFINRLNLVQKATDLKESKS